MSTSIVRWDPFRELFQLADALTRPAFFSRTDWGPHFIPAGDLVEDADGVTLRLDVPGMAPDDLSIEIRDRVLTVSGERRAESEGERRGHWHVERSFGRFSRHVTLPWSVDPDKVTAELDRGVLEIRIPKPEQVKAHRVSIKAHDDKKVLEGQVTSG